MKPDWTQDFFSGLLAEAQRRIPQQTPAEADFLQQVLHLKPGERVLDVPCGTGRLANELAARGFETTGLDISTDLLGDARREAADRKLTATFHHGDMREIPWTSHFDAGFCFGNSFSYFDDEDNLRFLKRVHAALKPGGRFALETHFIAETVFMQLTPKRWFPFGDHYFLHDTFYDPPTATITSSYIIINKGEITSKQAHYRVYTLREITRLFESAGFTGIETFGSLQREPFRLGAQGLWLIARRD